MSTIKVAKTFRLSAEAVRILESKDNATQFIEDLITGRGSLPAETKSPLTLDAIRDLIKTELKSSPAQPSTGFIPQAPDPITGYPCCTKQSPCKHWVWDEATTGWKNSLTGALKEVL